MPRQWSLPIEQPSLEVGAAVDGRGACTIVHVMESSDLYRGLYRDPIPSNR